jgi:L-2-hydroxyglutarate oxidase
VSTPAADVTIIGAGIVGLATARALLMSGEVGTVRLLEKEVAPGAHQSTHNSGVLHAGLQYRPGSLKARLARDGIRRMIEYCRHHGIAHDVCGKLVVARDVSELPRLDEMLERGRSNGLEGLRRLSREEARDIEPHVECVAAIQVPEEGIADYAGVCDALAREIAGAGGEVVSECEVRALRRGGGRWDIEGTRGQFQSRVIVNCAGLYSDRIASMAGSDPGCMIVPFRGEYHRLREGRDHLARHLIYPLPEPGFPFLGVHFTRRVTGGVDAGPNAVLAFAREGYSLGDVRPAEFAEAVAYPGLWRFVSKHPRMVARELGQSFSRARFVEQLQRLVPEVREDDLVSGGSGVRAQAMGRDGSLIDDFVWVDAPGAVHVINAPSPAATASLSIGSVIAGRARDRLRDSG